MQRKILFIVLVGIGLTILGGCSSDDNHPTTAKELKSFKGGPMPPEARKLFEASMRENAKRTAASISKAQSQVGAGGGSAQPPK
jgi:hypothetical protein